MADHLGLRHPSRPTHAPIRTPARSRRLILGARRPRPRFHPWPGDRRGNPPADRSISAFNIPDARQRESRPSNAACFQLACTASWTDLLGYIPTPGPSSPPSSNGREAGGNRHACVRRTEIIPDTTGASIHCSSRSWPPPSRVKPVLAEELTYSGMKDLCARLHIKLRGLAMEERACARTPSRRVSIVQGCASSTACRGLQNPTVP
jgi:hypothetical protein